MVLSDAIGGDREQSVAREGLQQRSIPYRKQA
jgi:hypothetical protein